jgi:SAM-dependent methyltransferase
MDLLVKRTAARFSAGVDPSEVMVEQAAALNAEAIGSGRVKLALATAENLPFSEGQFSKAFAVSNFLIWGSPQRGLDEIHRVLVPGGQVFLWQRVAPRRPHWWTSPGLTDEEVGACRAMMSFAGFQDIRMLRGSIRRRHFCLVGTKV